MIELRVKPTIEIAVWIAGRDEPLTCLVELDRETILSWQCWCAVMVVQGRKVRAVKKIRDEFKTDLAFAKWFVDESYDKCKNRTPEELGIERMTS